MSERLSQIEPGWDVYDGHGEKIGSVNQIGPNRAYLHVQKGLLFKKDFYIPARAITGVGDGRVMIDVPKDRIDDIGWDALPAMPGNTAPDGVREATPAFRDEPPVTVDPARINRPAEPAPRQLLWADTSDFGTAARDYQDAKERLDRGEHDPRRNVIRPDTADFATAARDYEEAQGQAIYEATPDDRASTRPSEGSPLSRPHLAEDDGKERRPSDEIPAGQEPYING